MSRPPRTPASWSAAAVLAVVSSGLIVSQTAAPVAAANPDGVTCVVSAFGQLSCTQDFTYTGAEQQFTAPLGASNLSWRLVGANGANVQQGDGSGRGAVVDSSMYLNNFDPIAASRTFFVNVGGNGSYLTGGWNGGGNAVTDGTFGGGGGGGATDVRTTSRDETGSLSSRLFVAGGGGGAARGARGGDAGNSGGGGEGGGGEATTTSGGAVGTNFTGASAPTSGSLGQGGDGGGAYPGAGASGPGGGGGGGLYGGGGGSTFGGGGGGSSRSSGGGTIGLNTTGLAPSAAVTWSYNDPSVLTVVAVSPSTATIQAGQSQAYTATATVSGQAYVDNQVVDFNQTYDAVAQVRSRSTGLTCDAGSCTATRAGTYSTSVRDIQTFSDTMQTLVVTPTAASTVAVTPGFQQATYGSPVTVSSSATDRYGNVIPASDSTISYALRPAAGGATTPCVGTVCSAPSAGAWDVVATVTAYGGTATGTSRLQVDKASQSLTSVGEQPTTARVGTTWSPQVTGGASGKPVTISVDPSSADVCSFDGGAVRFTGAGTCLVRADQDGDNRYTAAPRLISAVAVERTPTSVQVSLTPTTPVVGQDVVADVATDISTGTVQVLLDGVAMGEPRTPVDGSVEVTIPRSRITAGTHTVSVHASPADTATYASSTTSASLAVARATTTTSVTVTAHRVTATVSADAPSTSTPGGKVTFLVDGVPFGDVELVAGVAVLETETAGAHQPRVTAVYGGTGDHAGSSGSTVRQSPTIEATVKRAGSVAHGWDRGPVTVTYTCTTAGSALTTECPADVVLKDGANQSLTTTVTAENGGAASVTVGPFDIDTTAPTVALRDVPSEIRNGVEPDVTCVGTDATSGLASCSVATVKVGTRGTVDLYEVTATATDVAGNTATTAASTYGVRTLWVGRVAADTQGTWMVRRGRAALVHLMTTARPKLVGGGRTVQFRNPGRLDGNAHRIAQLRVPADAKPGSILTYRIRGEGISRMLRIEVAR